MKTTSVAPTIKVLPIEMWMMTAIVPPGTLPTCSTVNAGPVVVSVMSGELHAIVAFISWKAHAVPCCPYPPVLVPSNSESAPLHEGWMVLWQLCVKLTFDKDSLIRCIRLVYKVCLICLFVRTSDKMYDDTCVYNACTSCAADVHTHNCRRSTHNCQG